MSKLSTQGQIYWACRRGMLELDMLLIPFAENNYPQLTPEQKQAFEHLLSQSDQNLYAWLLGYKTCPDPTLHDIIESILKSSNKSDT